MRLTFTAMNAMIVVTLLMLVTWPLQVGRQDGSRPPRVTADAVIRELLHDGYERSPTLRALIDAVEGSRWRVLIQQGLCPARELRSCLLHVTGRFEGEPYLQIVIAVPGRHRDRFIQSLAHEMQHVVEVIQAPEVVDAVTLRALFKRIGVARVSNRAVTAYETHAAEAAGDAVLRELRRARVSVP